jgi:hypothetical protein
MARGAEGGAMTGRLARLFACALILALLLAPAHNARGGYIDACGHLPGMLGDDC